MNLHGTDIAIIVGYFLLITLVGVLFSKKATGSIENYFLGGRSLPWYLLGISGVATFIDIGGTAYQSGWYYLLGSKGFWFCMEGAVSLLVTFQMIYVGKWLFRSGVVTTAEWMTFRFGSDRVGKAARVICAITAVVIVVGIMSYFFVGSGRVLVEFLPFVHGNEKLAALAFFTLVGVYTISAGFYGVIFTDFVQALLIVILIGYVSYQALMVGTPEYFAEHAPEGWLELFPRDGNWSLSLPETVRSLSVYVEKAGGLGIFLIFWILKELLMGFASPVDPWTAQRYYAARNERESSLIACQWVSLLSLRFLLMGGMGVLALGYASKITDPEKALSVVVAEYLPVGVKGFMLAALLAAGMSTISSMANSAGAYFVNDIYREHINPKASQRQLVRWSYVITFVIMALGCCFGWFGDTISGIWGWILMGLFAAMLPPNILKWFWWRANGHSYVFGIIGGFCAALITKMPFWGHLSDWRVFIFVFGVSAFCSVLGALLFSPTENSVLVKFYQKTRPFGLWGPVRKYLSQKENESIAREARRDFSMLPVGLVWHLSLFMTMSSIVFKDWKIVGIGALTFVLASLILYKGWYRRLEA